jgi:hypothetical protein
MYERVGIFVDCLTNPARHALFRPTILSTPDLLLWIAVADRFDQRTALALNIRANVCLCPDLKPVYSSTIVRTCPRRERLREAACSCPDAGAR